MDNKILYLFDHYGKIISNKSYFINIGFMVEIIGNFHRLLKIDLHEMVISDMLWSNEIKNFIDEHYGPNFNLSQIFYMYRNGKLGHVQQCFFDLEHDYDILLEVINKRKKKKEKFQFVDFKFDI